MIVNTRISKSKREYYDYIRSDKWRKFRVEALNHCGWKCKKCGTSEKPEVHHINYKNLFQETLDDVNILCRSCHKGHHKKKLFKNGKQSKYMRNPSYQVETVTYIVKRVLTVVFLFFF